MNNDNQSLKEQTIATIDKIGLPIFSSVIMPFLTTNPVFQASLLGAYGMFGVYMQYNQNKVNNFIKILKENPGTFTNEIVKTEEFKDGFLIILESYLKERDIEKRENIRKIFLGFTNLKTEEKEKFELERILDINNKITLSEILFLKEINEKGSVDFNSKEKLGFEFISNDFFSIHRRNLLKQGDLHSSGEKYSDIIYGLISLGILKQIDKEESENDGFITKNDKKKNEFITVELTKLGKKFITYITENES